jgi:hypothetical protein
MKNTLLHLCRAGGLIVVLFMMNRCSSKSNPNQGILGGEKDPDPNVRLYSGVCEQKYSRADCTYKLETKVKE